MERTESTVIQVAPDIENDQIKEMELFGWNLQGRQEIHEEGDAYGRPSILNSDVYVTTQHVSHYVKLHFVRSLEFPNLERIRELETQYRRLPFPDFPSPINPAVGCVLFFLFWPALVIWFFVNKSKSAKAKAAIPAYIEKRDAIFAEVRSLVK